MSVVELPSGWERQVNTDLSSPSLEFQHLEEAYFVEVWHNKMDDKYLVEVCLLGSRSREAVYEPDVLFSCWSAAIQAGGEVVHDIHDDLIQNP